MGGVRHKRVGNTFFQYFADELPGVEDLGIYDDRHALDVSDGVDKFTEQRVLHLICDQRVAKQAAIDCQCSMQWVETSADLHFLDLVDRIAVGEIHPGILKGLATIGEGILDYQILAFLGIYEWCDIGVLVSDDELGILETVFLEHCLYIGIGAWGDLVNHGPREGYARFEVVLESFLSQSVCNPLPCDGHDSILEFLPVVRAVVHA